MVVDHPLYTLAKKIQCKFSETHEDKFAAKIGTMHFYGMIYSLLGECRGQWLHKCFDKWCSYFKWHNRAQSCFGVSHLIRTKYMHQVTALALYKLQQNAYTRYTVSNIDEGVLDMDEWVTRKTQTQIQFLYWYQTLWLELIAFQFAKKIKHRTFGCSCLCWRS